MTRSFAWTHPRDAPLEHAACAAQRHGRDERLLRAGRRSRRARRPACSSARTSSRSRATATQGGSRAPEAHQLPDHRADLLGPAPGVLRLQHDPGRARRAAGRQPGGPGLPGAEPRRQHRRLEPQLLREHQGRLPLPHDRRLVPAAADRRLAPVGHGADDAARRPHRRLRRAARARHDRPLHLLVRDARAVRRAAGRRSPTPRSGTTARSTRSTAACRSATARARPAAAARSTTSACSKGYAIIHSSGNRTSTHYNLAARRRDGADDEGGVHRALRRAALHGRRGRLRRRDPAVRVRPEPQRPARRRHPAVLVSRHGHADDPRRRLRAARALHGRHRRLEPEVAELGQPRMARGPERGTQRGPTPTGWERPATASA